MVRAVLCGLVLLVLFAGASWADPTRIIGHGRLFTNDYLGDGHDRWQSGSYVHSFVTGQIEEGPQPFGSMREYRFRSAIIASDGRGPYPGDRPYVGTIALGLHTHFGAGRTRSRIGGDLTIIGPQTGLSAFQSRVHRTLGMPRVRFAEGQLEDDILFGVSSETAEIIPLSHSATARVFGEAQIGPEDMIRVGADVLIGGGLDDDLLIRDVTTGHLYTGLDDPLDWGFSFVFGADTALVADSVFLPGDALAAPRKRRNRARAGLHWNGEGGTTLFYGLTYLGPQFDGQTGGQVTGSVKLNFDF